jgi:hypothetical protein
MQVGGGIVVSPKCGPVGHDNAGDDFPLGRKYVFWGRESPAADIKTFQAKAKWTQ